MRTRFIALIAGALVVTLGWFALAFRPAQSRLREVRTEVQTAQAEVATLEAKLSELQALKKNEPQLRAEAKRFDDALPTKHAVSAFIRQVNAAANEAGLDFVSIAPSLPAPFQPAGGAVPAPAAPPASGASPAPGASPTPAPGGATTNETPPVAAPSSPLQAVAISITGKGGFFEVEDFIAKLESLERAIRISDFNLSGGGGGAGGGAAAAPAGAPAAPTSGELNLSMQLQMFLRPAPQGAAAAGAPAPPPAAP